MPEADLATRFAEIIFQLYELIHLTDKAKANDAGANIGNDYEFHWAIRKLVTVTPTLVGDLLNLKQGSLDSAFPAILAIVGQPATR